MMFIAKILIFLLGLQCILAAEYCYPSVVKACAKAGESVSEVKNCDANYGAAEHIMFDLQNFANLHVTRSFDYLLFSTYFGAYQKNREGFKKLFRKLSDSAWEDGISLIKYITKRGGKMDFNARKDDIFNENGKTYELSELEGLSRALDSQKILAMEGHHIHALATRHKTELHEPEVASYLEKEYMHKFADTIRDLAGHVNDLKNMFTTNDGLSVYLFDEYLKSKY